MTTAPAATPPAMLWTGRVLSGLFVLFMLMDVGIKLAGVPQVAETLKGLGWSGREGFAIGVIELICLVLYLIPRTAVLGAALMMAVLGGAVATHWRVGSPLLGFTFFGIYVGLFMWGGLWLRDAGLRAIFPYRR